MMIPPDTLAAWRQEAKKDLYSASVVADMHMSVRCDRIVRLCDAITATQAHRDEMFQRELLDEFCRWLSHHGYLDDDWWCHEPKAIDAFVAEKKKA